VSRLVRHVGAVARGRAAWPELLLAAVWCGLLYGAVMGAFGGLRPDRLPQVGYSAVKVPVLLGATAALGGPAFFVLNSLLGLRADVRAAARAVLASLAVVAVVLAALAPYTAVWYLTTAGYSEAIGFNGLMFLAAGVAGQWDLRRRYAPLEARDRRHRWGRRAWLLLYAFVGVQMGWGLRPFVGDPATPPGLFRPGAWGGNAYVAVADVVWRSVAR
jgi:hypothetical protein